MSIEERQKTIKKHSKNNQKMPKNYPNLDFHHLKTVYKMLRLGIFPVFVIYLQQICWECGSGCSSITSWYRNTAVRTFLKLMIMIEHMKMMQITCLDIWSMFLSGQMPHRSNSSHLFWNLKDPVLR